MKLSIFLIPFSVFAHILTINVTLLVLTPYTYHSGWVILATNLSWLCISSVLNFYKVERKERFRTKFHRFLLHFFFFSLAYLSIFSLLNIKISVGHQLFTLGFLLFLLTFYRWFFFSLRKLYRIEGGNFVNVVVIGEDRNLNIIQKIFNEPDFGYRYKGCFHNNSITGSSFLGKIDDAYDYILNNSIDEIYCVVSQLSCEEIHMLISLADNNFKKLKLVPDNKGIITRAMNVELFETVPVLNLRNSPLERNYAKYGKRIFDILFSLLVIVFIMSWLIPLLFIINKIESNTPIFFRQIRNGYNKKSFYCYKFRSMVLNQESDRKMCERGDSRVTKLGRILRKTSIDELPQFFNVLKGEMSIVGPRPHMAWHTSEFSDSVDKYLVRHYAKPGITGLAQVKGYRGEIHSQSDIVNRTRFDIFYLEKWSPGLDLKIIYETFLLMFKGQENAF